MTRFSVMRTLYGYLFGIGCVLIAAIARLMLSPVLTLEVPFITFFVAVGLTAWYSGIGPAVFASILSALLAAYLFIPPLWSLQVNPLHLIAITVFSAEAIALAYLIHVLLRRIEQARQGKDELAMSEMRFRELVERSPFGIYVVNSKFRIAHMNEAGRHGAFRNVHPIIGRDFGEAMRILWPEPVAEKVVAIFRHTLKTGESYYSCEFLNPRADVDQTEAYEWELHRVTMPDGEYGVICYYFDSTKLRQAEEALREAQARLQHWNAELEQAVQVKTAELLESQERLRRLATELNLAEQRERKRLATELHDHLQQMLVAGKMMIGQGKRAATGVPQCEHALQKIDDLLSDALTYSRTLVAELSPSVLHEFGLPAALRWLAEQMKQFELTVTVQLQIPEELRLSEDQAILLFQSTRELLINSAKHAGTKEAIIKVTQEDGTLRLVVQDQGIGFDPTVAQAGSTKFGLFSIRERMYAMGGRWEIHSASGKGTTAILSLPYESVSGPVEKEVVASSSAGIVIEGSLIRQGAACRILLVDDHVMVRQGLKSLLDAYPDIQVVGEADNGQDAVELAARLQPSIILMDINMPKMNGIAATERIKTQWPQILVIGLSVNASEDNAGAMKQAGATLIMTKEAAVDELHGAIQEALKVSVSLSL
jgi:signal transduction histidine kinase/ActR/RegA family two-component response regulator